MEAPAAGTPAGEERIPPARRATGVGYVLLWAALAAVVAALVGLGPLKPLVSYIAYLDDGGAMTSTEEPETAAPRPADVTLVPPPQKAGAAEAAAPELEPEPEAPELEPEPEAPGTARAADGGQDLAIGLSEAARAFIGQHDWAKPMRVPEYCFTGVQGEVVVPHVEKAPTFTPPSREAGDLILKLVSTDLPCLVLRPECELTPAPVGDYRDTLPESRRPGRFHEHLFDRKMLGKPAAERMKRLPNLKPGALGTCAMVGNADSLLKAAAGPTIDAHDFVMRFNVLTRGWEKHVGRRVDGLFHKAEYNQPKNKKRPYKTKYNGVQVPKRLWMFPQYRHPRENLVRKGKKMVLFGSDYRESRGCGRSGRGA